MRDARPLFSCRGSTAQAADSIPGNVSAMAVVVLRYRSAMPFGAANVRGVGGQRRALERPRRHRILTDMAPTSRLPTRCGPNILMWRPRCRTTLGITALPTPIAIELKCLAVLPEDH
jgi:hypothetical protein